MRYEPSRPGIARGPMAGPGGPDAGHEALSERLERYAADTAIDPPEGLAWRILACIDAEPLPTVPWRFLLTLVKLDGRGALRDFRQTARTAFDRRAPAVLRTQALALVLLTALTLGAIGAAGAATVGPMLQDLSDPPAPDVIQAPSETQPMRSKIVGPIADPEPSDDHRREAVQSGDHGPRVSPSARDAVPARRPGPRATDGSERRPPEPAGTRRPGSAATPRASQAAPAARTRKTPAFDVATMTDADSGRRSRTGDGRRGRAERTHRP